MLRVLTLALVLVAAGLLAVPYLDSAGRTPAAAAVARAPVTQPMPGRSIVLSKGRNGHFKAEARIDGRRIDVLVDTGASHIALRQSDAAKLGIYPRSSDFTVRVSTANGITKAAPVQLRTVEVGDIAVRDVTAIVHPDEGLSVNLLGMSFLSRLRWSHDRGKLVLEQ